MTITTSVFAQFGAKSSNSITISPFSLPFGRVNLRYEKLTDKSITYGSRVEISSSTIFGTQLWVLPYGRAYFFSQESNGLYGEVDAGFRAPITSSNFNTGGVIRAYLGGQFFSGSQRKIPFDIAIGLNYDTDLQKRDELETAAFALFGPLSLFTFRVQTGFSF